MIRLGTLGAGELAHLNLGDAARELGVVDVVFELVLAVELFAGMLAVDRLLLVTVWVNGRLMRVRMVGRADVTHDCCDGMGERVDK